MKSYREHYSLDNYLDGFMADKILDLLRKSRIKSCTKLCSTWASQQYASPDMLSEAIMDLCEKTSDALVALRAFLIVMRDS